MQLSLSSLQKIAQVTHQKEELMNSKVEHAYIEGGNVCSVCVCLLFGVNAHEHVQTGTGMRDFVPCQCSKPDWQCFLSSQMFLLWSFSFIRLGQNTKPECWNKLSGFPKAPYLGFWFCSCKEGFQRLLSSPAQGACCHPATKKVEAPPNRRDALGPEGPFSKECTLLWKMLHSEPYCWVLVDHVLDRKKCSELMPRRRRGSDAKLPHTPDHHFSHYLWAAHIGQVKFVSCKQT